MMVGDVSEGAAGRVRSRRDEDGRDRPDIFVALPRSASSERGRPLRMPAPDDRAERLRKGLRQRRIEAGGIAPCFDHADSLSDTQMLLPGAIRSHASVCTVGRHLDGRLAATAHHTEQGGAVGEERTSARGRQRERRPLSKTSSHWRHSALGALRAVHRADVTRAAAILHVQDAPGGQAQPGASGGARGAAPRTEYESLLATPQPPHHQAPQEMTEAIPCTL